MHYMLTTFGTIALDTTRTPFRTVKRALGGAATYAALSSRFYMATSIVGVIGKDFPREYKEILDNELNTLGITKRNDENTFHYDSSFDYTLSNRTTNKTELNAILGYEPRIPDDYLDSEYLYLANNDPSQNIKMLNLFSGPRLTICDTIDFWIRNKREEVLRMISRANGVIINEMEAKLLCKEDNLIKCAKYLISVGPQFTVIKKGENGALLFVENETYPIFAFPREEIHDPTGAGDSFAGAFIGYLASERRTNVKSLKKALLHGNIMGSFVIEDFGIKKLLTITKEDIDGRHAKFRELSQF